MSEEVENKEVARLKAVNLCFETPPELIPELTWLNRRETFIYPIISMIGKLLDMNRKPGTLMRYYIDDAVRYRRSLAGQHLMALHKTVLSEYAATPNEEEEMAEEEL